MVVLFKKQLVLDQNTYKLKSLFDECYASLVMYSLSIVRDKDDAEDLVQAAFVSLWRKMDAVSFDTSARAYLYKTVYNASLDLLKHQKVRKRYEHEMKGAQGATYPVHGQEAELHKRIESAIDELPEQCRRIFTMNRYDGLRYKEIARILHISEKTVENQISKALKVLRARLAEYLTMTLLILNFFYGKR